MADIAAMLDEIQHRALREIDLRRKILATKEAEDPLEEFCKICRSYGYEIYVMDVICAGEEFHAAMKRSTNGGGENSPKLANEDDFYEMLLSSLE
ncbi:MAG: hypothetical protein J5983_04430 [Ruminococcus sp.]|nr:hypothetical protein [Ruminococcus sp.]